MISNVIISGMMTIEKARDNDIPAIIDIENGSFSNPWSKEQVASSIENTFVVRDEAKVAGFMCLEFALDEVHIMHMAVHPDSRRRGIGRLMMEKILGFPGNRYFLEVRESNICAQKLYESFGFKIIDRRKNYYQDNDETAFIMELVKDG